MRVQLMLEFYASLTDGPSVFRRTLALIDGLSTRPPHLFSRILSTPLMLNNDALGLLRTLKETHGASVLFDSGGYYVQIGRVAYHELYAALLARYLAHPWADWYILPDHVPTSQDSPEVVEAKVRETVSFSSMFYTELPAALRERAVAVVHGHTRAQVEYCIERYITLGVRALGFGSFTTAGKGQEANIAAANDVANARAVVDIAHELGMRVHLFGLGAPSLVAMLHGIAAESFDSASWIKAAGFGQVHLPFMRGYNVTYQSSRSRIQKGITWDDFDRLKRITRHECDFCQDYRTLNASKMHRAVHNLVCVTEAVDHINTGRFDLVRQIYASGSPKYREAANTWLPHR